MVSIDHEILVELFRQRGELAPLLLQRCAAIDLAHDHVEQATIDLAEVAPATYHADAIARLCGRDGETTAAVITEIQLRADEDKRFTWPQYVTSVRARLRCPVFLLVVAPEQRVAAWASQTIEIGHPGFVLRPIVIAFPEMPRIVNAVDAKELPELAVLSALAHRDHDVVMAALSAIRTLAESEHRLYKDIILSSLPADLRQALEKESAMIDLRNATIYNSHFARAVYEHGKGDGERRGLQAVALGLARAKIEHLTDEDEALLRAQADPNALTALIISLGQAITERDARDVLDAALRSTARSPA